MSTPSEPLGYPEEFLRGMRARLGEDYPAFALALSRPPEAALRLNPRRAWDDLPAGAGEAVPWEPLGRYVPSGFRPGSDIAHFAGAYYMQEASAMLAVAALDPKPGERVLDLCAAPGGKSGQIAARLEGRGFLLANETETARAKILSGNLERLGVLNAVVTSMRPDELARLWPEYFDAVLVDAPCSGEGMFRRDAQARAQWTPQSPAGCAARQKLILAAAARLVRPGGRLLYSTCTFNEGEDEGVAADFRQTQSDFRPLPFALNGLPSAEEGMVRLWPHKARGEGHFAALFQKEGSPPETLSRGPTGRDLPPTLREVLRRWPFDGAVCEERGDKLYALPGDAPPLDGARVLRRGLHLCRLGKGYTEPDHALAMALAPEDARRVLALDEAEARRYLRGEVLPCPEELRGWTLVVHRGLPLGWGKAVAGACKNHLPKGLRTP